MDKEYRYATQLVVKMHAINRYIVEYNKQLMYLASKSHYVDVANCNTTFAQIVKINKLISQRDIFVSLRDAVIDSVNSMTDNNRRLVIAIYVKKYAKPQIANKYDCSLRTLYRRLIVAHKQLVKNLCARGITMQWMIDNIKPLVVE